MSQDTVKPMPAKAASSPAAATPASASPAPTSGQSNTATVQVSTNFVNSIQVAPSTVLTGTGVLLALLIGLYTLIGRERKSPYLINSLFEILVWCVIAAIASLIGLIWSSYQGAFATIGAASLVIALLLTLWRVHKMYMRFALFVDSANPKQFYLARWLKHYFRRASEGKPYEWNATPLPPTFQTKIRGILKSPVQEGKPLSSAAIALTQHGKANEIISNLALAFLQEKYAVQYMTASRHPIEFIGFLKEQVQKANIDWQTAATKIVVVDAYTKHFGYADSVYFAATTKLKKEFGVTCVRSGDSFAGLHTASSRAFNELKRVSKSKAREPVLVIYEDCYAIADLESREQYRVFVRHVVPSERMWEGMFTVFIETAQEEADWKLLSAYCDVALEVKAEG